MAKNNNHEVDQNIESLSKAESFVTKNNKKIVAVVLLLAAAAIAFVSVRSCSDKKTEKGHEAAVAPELAFYAAYDSLSTANALAELESYMDEHGKYAAGIAAFEAGIAAYEIKDYNKAIEHFSAYEGNDPIFNARALACIGDCYVELGDFQKAYENFASAVKAADNEFASEYAFKAGLVAEKLGNNEDALAMYQTVKDQYPSTPRAMDIDKYISRVEAK